MMINKRLINAVGESRKYTACNVALQWLSLAANIAMMASLTRLLAGLFDGSAGRAEVICVLIVSAAAIVVRCICTRLSSRMSFLSSRAVKRKLRGMIYEKLLRLGSSYNDSVGTAEVVQVAVEGVDQLEVYFGSYLPQFFYAILAPLTLFVVLSFVSLPCAIVLLVCVPLIPVAIVAVQRWAKKLLSRYWGQYTALGDSFLENLQGLTTLKIYQADELKQQEMNEEAERFRRITMKVLTMQLNSVTVMDLIAYGGAALGVIMASRSLAAGAVTLSGCLLIILLSADFFIPMRLLGSFFHIAMNGMAASDKIFRLLDLPEPDQGGAEVPEDCTVVCSDLHFSYDGDREILHGIDASFRTGGLTAVVGESGCGKSTLSAILMGRSRGYTGSVTVGGRELSEIDEAALLRSFTYVGDHSYIFKGSVRDNLLMGCPDATDAQLWEVLDKVNLSEFLRGECGLDTALEEKGANFSGGQCQRLALARALLHDSEVYIFDEATSNIDAESENDIMSRIYETAKEKTVILISHRLANVVGADRIYVLDGGRVAECGTHSELLGAGGTYACLWNAQQSLENYGLEKHAEKREPKTVLAAAEGAGSGGMLANNGKDGDGE